MLSKAGGWSWKEGLVRGMCLITEHDSFNDKVAGKKEMTKSYVGAMKGQGVSEVASGMTLQGSHPTLDISIKRMKND